MDEDQSAADVRNLTGEIVTSYLANNSVRSDDLPRLIQTVYDALTNLGQPAAKPAAEPLTKPVSVKKSIHNDYLISMEDGKQYQSLKRHLAKRGLTPADYRTKWDLPSDYPMTAPGYSERRSAIAMSLGLGRKRSEAAANNRAEALAPAAEEVEAAAEKPKRGRKKAKAAEQAD